MKDDDRETLEAAIARFEREVREGVDDVERKSLEIIETAKRRGPSTPDFSESEFAQQVARLVAETMLRIQEHRARFEMQVQRLGQTLLASAGGLRFR